MSDLEEMGEAVRRESPLAASAGRVERALDPGHKPATDADLEAAGLVRRKLNHPSAWTGLKPPTGFAPHADDLVQVRREELNLVARAAVIEAMPWWLLVLPKRWRFRFAGLIANAISGEW